MGGHVEHRRECTQRLELLDVPRIGFDLAKSLSREALALVLCLYKKSFRA